MKGEPLVFTYIEDLQKQVTASQDLDEVKAICEELFRMVERVRASINTTLNARPTIYVPNAGDE